MIAYICSRYQGDLTERRCNLVEHDAICRWAQAQGYAVVSWAVGLDRDHPPEDVPEARGPAQARDRELAGMVAAWMGSIVIPLWYEDTLGMTADIKAAQAANEMMQNYEHVDLPDVLPFVPVPWCAAIEARARGYEWRGLVPGPAMVDPLAVRRVISELKRCRETACCNCDYSAFETAIDIVAEETGVEVTL